MGSARLFTKLQIVTVALTVPSRTNLPPSATLFVGREAQLDALQRAVRAAACVVVHGAAGVGKSRLAQELGWRWLGASEGATAWVAQLGPIRGLEGALRRMGATLGLTFGPAEAADDVVTRIADALAAQARPLLLLDDAEGVADELPDALGRITRAAPAARLLVTSRRVLRSLDATRVELAPLPAEEARDLLVDRARRVRPGFALDDRHRAAVDELIRRLDGLPLAVELIAPRLRLLTPPQLLERFERAHDPKHALERTLERSWELLRPWERDALAQTSVFRDGFFLEAAESVIDLGDHPDAPDVLSVLEGLVAQSLLRTTTVRALPDLVRIQPFEVVRELAEARLRDGGRARRRHAAYYLDAAERWDAGIETADEVEHTSRLVVELPNLEAAYERAEDDEQVARFGLLLHLAYQRSGPFAGQAALVERAVEAARSQGERLLSRAMLARARVQRWGNDPQSAVSDLEHALALASACGDVTTEAACYRNLAANCFRLGDVDGFARHIGAALEAASRSESPADEVNARNGLGYLHDMRGDHDRAQDELDRALALARRTGTPGLIALSLSSLAEHCLRRGRLEEAERYCAEAIERYEGLSYLRQLALELLVRARVRGFAGHEGAAGDAARALETARRMGLRAPVARALELSAVIAFHERDYVRARELVEQALERGALGRAPAAHAYDAAARAMLGHATQAREAMDRALAAAGEEHGALLEVLAAFVTAAERRRGGDRDVTDLRELAEARLRADHPEVRRAARHLADVLGGEPEETVRLELTADARWFRLGDGDSVDITRRRALRGILRSLSRHRVEAPGRPLPLDDVLEAGWPGERMSPESGARRVYVTINRLRKLGLGDLVLTMGDGYMLAPRVEVVTVEIG